MAQEKKRSSSVTNNQKNTFISFSKLRKEGHFLELESPASQVTWRELGQLCWEQHSPQAKVKSDTDTDTTAFYRQGQAPCCHGHLGSRMTPHLSESLFFGMEQRCLLFNQKASFRSLEGWIR
ncbi:hypothetical protein MG293_003043 [Ovis ammon polii]|uniref:Uncharacterized protein n=1 Tax=Ovis ammon polii TaxID=230172 RepID=A0AAD4UHS1_OVIAM|nr:hypothetical protein MG293_003043 [Ovis ammon polii]